MAKKNIYPVLPLRDIVVYPKMIVPLFVGREKSIRALQEVVDQDQNIILLTQKEAAIEDPTENDVYHVGTVGTVLQMLKLPDGTVKVLIEGMERVKISKFIDNPDYMEVEAEILPDAEDNSTDTKLWCGPFFLSLKNMSNFRKKRRRRFWFRSIRLKTTANWPIR